MINQKWFFSTILVLVVASFIQIWPLDVDRDIIAISHKHIGSPYQTGGIRPPAFDCSGFISFLIKPFVPQLPRLSRDMASFATPIAKNNLQPGDLVFFATTATPGAISHVAMYIGNDEIIHSISDGPQRGVTISSLETRYWKNHFNSCARVLPISQTIQPPTPAPSAKAAPQAKPAPAAKPSSPQAPTVQASPKAPPKAAPKPSPWDTWDGVIEGDYAAWKAQENKRYEDFKKKERGGK